MSDELENPPADTSDPVLSEEPPAQPVKKATASRFRCGGCSADLAFEPVDGTLTCPYCGRKEQIPKSADEVVEHSYERFLQEPRATAPIAEGALEVECDGCGAKIEFIPPEVAARCNFCGREIVAQPKAADPMIAPEGVLPFLITSPNAAELITGWISSRWFAPSGLKRLARQEKIGGIYLPFWTYDSQTTSFYSGERGEYYYTTESYTTTENGRSVRRTRRVRHTRWYPAEGQVARFFDDVVVPATQSVQPARLDQLEPWDLDQVVPYDPAYLAGFKAHRYETELVAGFERGKEIMAAQIEQDVREDIGGDEQRVTDIRTSFGQVTFKHLLLPVYLAAYNFNHKTYQVMVNARTGEVVGERPYSIWKIFAAIILCFIIGFGIMQLSVKTNSSPRIEIQSETCPGMLRDSDGRCLF